MKISDHLKYVASLIEVYKRREICLAKALNCKSESEKIIFYNNDFYTGDWDDLEDENWVSIKTCFLDEINLKDDDFDFLFIEIDFLCTKEDNKFGNEYNALLKETKIIFQEKFSNSSDLIRNYKLYQFSSWFKEPNAPYKFFMERLKEHIEDEKKELAMKDEEYNQKLQKLLN